MATTVLLAEVGAGKTEAALARLTQLVTDPSKPFARAWVLVATRRQEVAFRERLAHYRDERQVYFNVEFFGVYQLNRRLLRLASQPVRSINDAAQQAIIRWLIRRAAEQGQLRTFSAVAAAPGFARVVLDFISELKQNLIQPQEFWQAARTDKDHDLAYLYQAYQAVLMDAELVDTEGEGWLALEALAGPAGPLHSIDMLIVDGFDQFTAAQAHLLTALSGIVGQMLITLTMVSPQQASIGRRFERALSQLRHLHNEAGLPFTTEVLRPAQVRHEDLLVLAANIGRQGVVSVLPATDSPVRLIEMPDPEQEVAAVLREVKRLLLAGTSPDDILIALRDWAGYDAHFASYEQRYGLPLLRHYAEAVAQNPAVNIFLRALSLCGADPDDIASFTREEVLAVLRSPYLRVPGLDVRVVNLLAVISETWQVIGGRKQWQDALRQVDESYDYEQDQPVEALLTPQEASDISLALEDFFRMLIPPAQASLLDIIGYVERLLGEDPERRVLADLDEMDDDLASARSLNLIAGVRAGQRADLIARDIEALQRLRAILRGYIMTHELLETTLGLRDLVAWSAFLSDLKTSLRLDTAPVRNPVRSGRVLVTTATNARGLPHRHLFILGMAEGSFPVEPGEDPLYLDSERRALAERGIPLRTQDERIDDEGLYYELICLPSETLTLSRPTTRGGKTWNPSHLWRQSVAVFAPDTLARRSLRVGGVIRPVDAASPEEASTALVAMLTSQTARENAIPDEDWGIAHWFTTHAQVAPYWQAIDAARQIEWRRLSRQPHDQYSGHLQHDAARRIVSRALYDGRQWSATQFNELADCGYRFFARRMLNLQAIEETQETLDPLTVGNIYHAILEETYRRVMEEDLLLEPENTLTALEFLDEVTAEIFAQAPFRFSVVDGPVWQQQQPSLQRRLRTLIRQDFNLSERHALRGLPGPRRVYGLELPFGRLGDADAVPVRVPLTDGDVWVRGKIDRIDQFGDQLVVIDYKTGIAEIREAELTQGRNFQMLVYLLAVSAIVAERGDNLTIGGGTFWHIRNNKAEPLYTIEQLEGGRWTSPAVEAGLVHLNRYIQHARVADFRVQPTQINGGKCSAHCDYAQLCRVAVTHRRKPAN